MEFPNNTNFDFQWEWRRGAGANSGVNYQVVEKSFPGFGEKVTGPLRLQDHGGDAWFGNLKIRVLP